MDVGRVLVKLEMEVKASRGLIDVDPSTTTNKSRFQSHDTTSAYVVFGVMVLYCCPTLFKVQVVDDVEDENDDDEDDDDESISCNNRSHRHILVQTTMPTILLPKAPWLFFFPCSRSFDSSEAPYTTF